MTAVLSSNTAVRRLLRTIAQTAHPFGWSVVMSRTHGYAAIMAPHIQVTEKHEDSGTPGMALIAESVKGNNAAFIAAFCPAVALALLDRIDELERDRSSAWREVNQLRDKLTKAEGGERSEIPF